MTPQSSGEELDGERIQRIIREKRAANRLRSFFIIGLSAVLIVAIQVVLDLLR